MKKNKLLSISSLSIGIFCILMRLGYPMLMTKLWVFYILPILSLLAILFGCISILAVSNNKKTIYFTIGILIAYVIYVFIIKNASIIMNMPIEVFCFALIVIFISTINTHLKTTQRVSCSLGIAFGFMQFAISVGDIFFFTI